MKKKTKIFIIFIISILTIFTFVFVSCNKNTNKEKNINNDTKIEKDNNSNNKENNQEHTENSQTNQDNQNDNKEDNNTEENNQNSNTEENTNTVKLTFDLGDRNILGKSTFTFVSDEDKKFELTEELATLILYLFDFDFTDQAYEKSFSFIGWKLNDDDKYCVDLLNDEINFDHDVTLKAQWKENKEINKNTYKLTLKYKGFKDSLGNEELSFDILNGTEINKTKELINHFLIIKNQENKYFDFEGNYLKYFVDEKTNQKIDENYIIDKDVTLVLNEDNFKVAKAIIDLNGFSYGSFYFNKAIIKNYNQYFFGVLAQLKREGKIANQYVDKNYKEYNFFDTLVLSKIKDTLFLKPTSNIASKVEFIYDDVIDVYGKHKNTFYITQENHQQMYHTLLFLRCKHINFFEDFNFRYIREEGKTALFKPLYYPEKYFYKDTKLTIMKNPVLVKFNINNFNIIKPDYVQKDIIIEAGKVDLDELYLGESNIYPGSRKEYIGWKIKGSASDIPIDFKTFEVKKDTEFEVIIKSK